MTIAMWCSTSSTVSPRVSRSCLMTLASSSTSLCVRPLAGSSSSSSFGSLTDRPGQLDALQRAEGQARGGHAGVARQVQLLQDAVRLLAHLPLLAADTDLQRRLQEAHLGAAVHADHHVVEDAQSAPEGEVLERAADADAGDLVRRRAPAAICVLEGDRALGRVVDPADDVEHRRLAGAVRTDDRADVAGPHLEGDAVERDDPSEAHGQALYRQQVGLLAGIGQFHHAPLVSGRWIAAQHMGQTLRVARSQEASRRPHQTVISGNRPGRRGLRRVSPRASQRPGATAGAWPGRPRTSAAASRPPAASSPAQVQSTARNAGASTSGSP